MWTVDAQPSGDGNRQEINVVRKKDMAGRRSIENILLNNKHPSVNFFSS